MNVLVIDVAAQIGGAVTILEQFIEEFSQDKNNDFFVVLSALDYNDRDNIKFLKYKWVKKSYIHRLFFDYIYIRRIVRSIKPGYILSLQNATVSVKGVRQEVYFHNALPISEKRYSIFESKKMWFYQNVIGAIVKKSLKRASVIYVQANWIKKKLTQNWAIEESKISVKRPYVNIQAIPRKATAKGVDPENGIVFFYPANSAVYKNHENLFRACAQLWDNDTLNFSLVLTGDLNRLNEKCKTILQGKSYPVKFVGRLNKDQMREYYISTTLVFPSYIETVGLPLIEAKSYGAQILASDCEYAHESIGKYDAVTYFDPFDVTSIKEAIRKTCLGVD